MNDIYTELTTLTDELSFSNNFLYHYTTADSFLSGILPTKSISFNEYRKMRDPFEYKKNSFLTSPAGEICDYHFKTDRLVSEFVSTSIKTACFCLNYNHIKNNDIVMSRGFSKSRMWSAYAGQHSGVCLVFDRQELISQIEEHFAPNMYFAKKVKYTSDIYLSHLEYDITRMFRYPDVPVTSDDIFEKYKKYFFIKDSDYSDADEFRIVIHDSTPGSHLVPYGSALKAVILGDNFDKSKLEEISSLLDGKDVKVFDYFFRDFIYNLKPVSI